MAPRQRSAGGHRVSIASWFDCPSRGFPFAFCCDISAALFGAMALLNRGWRLIGLTAVIILVAPVLDPWDKKLGSGLISLAIGWSVIPPPFLLGIVANSFQNVIPRIRA